MRFYRPGEWLRQIDLERKFQGSQYDMRSALEELAVRKTIEHIPNRGYRVAAVDPATYEAIRGTRVILEVGAVPGIIAGIHEATIQRLRSLAAEFSAAVLSGTRVEQSRINGEFHHLTYAAYGNAVLEGMVWSLRDRLREPDITVWSSHEDLVASDLEHHELVDALTQRDTERLTAPIRRHIA